MHDLVAIGAYTKDTIVTAKGTSYVDGGGFAYASAAAAVAGINVAAVTKLAAEDNKIAAPLEARGIKVYLRPSAHSTLMRLEYPNDNPDDRILRVAAVVDPYTIADIEGVASRGYLLSASIRGEIPLEVVSALRKTGALMAADVQGFVRVVGEGGTLNYKEWPERDAVLSQIDILKSDAVEAEFLTGQTNLHKAAAALAAFGPREIVLTHKDGVVVLTDGVYFDIPFDPIELRGRSGRGDTCIGSYVSRRLSAPPAESARWAGAVTSIKLEAQGLVVATAKDAEARIRRY